MNTKQWAVILITLLSFEYVVARESSCPSSIKKSTYKYVETCSKTIRKSSYTVKNTVKSEHEVKKCEVQEVQIRQPTDCRCTRYKNKYGLIKLIVPIYLVLDLEGNFNTGVLGRLLLTVINLFRAVLRILNFDITIKAEIVLFHQFGVRGNLRLATVRIIGFDKVNCRNRNFTKSILEHISSLLTSLIRSLLKILIDVHLHPIMQKHVSSCRINDNDFPQISGEEGYGEEEEDGDEEGYGDVERGYGDDGGHEDGEEDDDGGYRNGGSEEDDGDYSGSRDCRRCRERSRD